jgi:FMN reductase
MMAAEPDVPRPVRILGLGGSLRERSLSLGLLRATLNLAAANGAETVLADLRQLELPMYNPDRPLSDYPPAMNWLLEQARAADAFIFCSTTYHGTIPGVVKNALDALDFLIDDTPRYLGGKPVGLVALGGPSAANVITALGHAARGLNALAISTVVTASGRMIDPDRLEITDEATRDRAGRLVTELISITHRLRQPDPTRYAERQAPFEAES